MKNENQLRERIITVAQKYGADYVGFGSIDRFEGSPVRKIFDKTQTVICLGFRVLRGSLRGIEEGSTYYQYCTTGLETIEETILPMALLKVCGCIEDEGYLAVPQKRNQLIMEKSDDTNPEMLHEEIYRGLGQEPQLDYAKTAVLCGIGEPGMSEMVLTEENGPFQRFGFILTDAVLEETPLTVPHLCDGCMECQKSCPGGAIDSDGNRNHWQCAAYYAGANMSKNPFMPPEAYEDLVERDKIVRGEKQLSKQEAEEVLERTFFYPPIKHGYIASICGKACERACYVHLEQSGKLKNEFRTQFRKRKEWKLENVLA